MQSSVCKAKSMSASSLASQTIREITSKLAVPSTHRQRARVTSHKPGGLWAGGPAGTKSSKCSGECDVIRSARKESGGRSKCWGDDYMLQ